MKSEPNFSLWIVDDDKAQSDLMRTLAKRISSSVPVEVFATGKSALDALDGSTSVSKSRAVLLCDMHLSDMSALDLLSTLRKDSKYSQTPFIVFSGAENAEDRHKSYLLGASAYIVKPFGLEDLSSFLDSLVTFYSWCWHPN